MLACIVLSRRQEEKNKYFLFLSFTIVINKGVKKENFSDRTQVIQIGCNQNVFFPWRLSEVIY